ncbi:MAG: hypothetical protein H7144_08150 [Burkholderiales bacterium]|nr:hypothetical protein [Phycisphaerae bacterium]
MKLIKSLLACCALGVVGLTGSNALAGGWSFDFGIVAGDPGRVWVAPVYETRCERVWVAPVYESRCERVWVPDRFEDRDVRYYDDRGRVIVRCERVLVERAHWTEVTRQVLVREGGWQMIEKQVCVREGYWAPTRRHLDVRVDHGDAYVSSSRRNDDDADRYRDARDRDTRARDSLEPERYQPRDARDRGDRYR